MELKNILNDLEVFEYQTKNHYIKFRKKLAKIKKIISIIEVLYNPNCVDAALFYVAIKHGDDELHKSVLNNPKCNTIKTIEGDTPLHFLALFGNINKLILEHPECSKIKNKYGRTPLHIIARKDSIVLNHPDCDKAKDNNGRTPLHILAHNSVEEAKTHCSYDCVKDNDGKTPKDLFESTKIDWVK